MRFHRRVMSQQAIAEAVANPHRMRDERRRGAQIAMAVVALCIAGGLIAYFLLAPPDAVREAALPEFVADARAVFVVQPRETAAVPEAPPASAWRSVMDYPLISGMATPKFTVAGRWRLLYHSGHRRYGIYRRSVAFRVFRPDHTLVGTIFDEDKGGEKWRSMEWDSPIGGPPLGAYTFQTGSVDYVDLEGDFFVELLNTTHSPVHFAVESYDTVGPPSHVLLAQPRPPHIPPDPRNRDSGPITRIQDATTLVPDAADLTPRRGEKP